MAKLHDTYKDVAQGTDYKQFGLQDCHASPSDR